MHPPPGRAEVLDFPGSSLTRPRRPFGPSARPRRIAAPMHRPWGRTLAGRFLGICLPAAAVLLGGLRGLPAPLPPIRREGPARPGLRRRDLRPRCRTLESRPRRALRHVERRLRRGETLAEVLRGLGLAASRRASPRWRPSARHRRAASAAGRHAATWPAVAPDGELAAFDLELDGRGDALGRPRGRGLAIDLARRSRGRSRPGPSRVSSTVLSRARSSEAGAPPDLAYAVGRGPAVGPRLQPRPPDAATGSRSCSRRSCLEGSASRLGNVLAVRYANRGRTLEAYRFGDGRVLRRRGPAAAEDVPALSDALLARHLALLDPALPPGPEGRPAALRRRLRRARGHAGARHRRGSGHSRRLGRRRRQDGEGAPSERLRHRLPSPLPLRRRAPSRRPRARRARSSATSERPASRPGRTSTIACSRTGAGSIRCRSIASPPTRFRPPGWPSSVRARDRMRESLAQGRRSAHRAPGPAARSGRGTQSERCRRLSPRERAARET